jgi:hypothetical protein
VPSFNPYELQKWMNEFLYAKLKYKELTLQECAAEMQKRALEIYTGY